MVLGLDHIALIVSSEKSIDFYKTLGFVETSRKDRGYDVIVTLSLQGICLDVYIDATHPPRQCMPETMGIRHFALKVDDLNNTIRELGLAVETNEDKNGLRFAFIKDPDGLPVELHE